MTVRVREMLRELAMVTGKKFKACVPLYFVLIFVISSVVGA